MIIDKKKVFEIVELDEPDYNTDISINMPPKKPTEETKRPLYKDSKTIQLF